jgi:UDP-glucose 4-epimerase
MFAFQVDQWEFAQQDQIFRACNDVDQVFHLAANPDVGSELLIPGCISTRTFWPQQPSGCKHRHHVKEIAFTSSSTIYGQANIVPTPENYGPLVPISMYGASKLACEAMITAYCHTFDMRSWIFRFANIIGDRGTHGIIVDLSISSKGTLLTWRYWVMENNQILSHVRECVMP